MLTTEIRECDLVRAPSMGKNGVTRNFPLKAFKFEDFSVYKLHSVEAIPCLGKKNTAGWFIAGVWNEDKMRSSDDSIYGKTFSKGLFSGHRVE